MCPKPTQERVLRLASWHDDWSGLRVAVLGLGVTGFSVADTLAELGCQVRVIAAGPDPDRERLLQVIGAEFVMLKSDDEQLENLQSFDPDLVVVSPGYRPDHPLTSWAEQQGIPVWGDIELGWRLRDKTGRIAEWLLVTGTNGKTTTTQLTAHMIKAGGKKVAPVGNIGTPILDALRDPEGFDALVVELSSFQLHRLGRIEPWASVVLNLADDHLDWHGSPEAYRAAKAKVYENTKVACVYNRAEPETERMVENADVIEGARAVSFGLDVPPRSGVGLVADPETGQVLLVDRTFHEDRAERAHELMTLNELHERHMAQPHMVANILAASTLARSFGVSCEDIAAAVLSFTPDAHRVERVAYSQGVTWIDDSKATNAHAADASLRAFDPVVWILGGLLKGVDIAPLVSAHASRLKAAIIIGEDREAVREALAAEAPAVPVTEIAVTDAEQVMPEAVARAAEYAAEGDTVLLAPAAASMDQFTDYADRGRRFAEAVQAFLKQSES